MKKAKNRKNKTILWITGSLLVLAIITVPKFIRERAQINQLIAQGSAQYVHGVATKYEANLREWSDDDAYSLLGDEERIVKTTQYPDFADGETPGIEPPDIDQIQPLVLYDNDQDEQVAIVNGELVYSNRLIKGRWSPMIYYVSDEFLHIKSGGAYSYFFNSNSYSTVINALLPKTESLGLSIGSSTVAANMTPEAIEMARANIYKEMGVQIDDEINGFIYVEASQMKDGIPFFNDYRENNYACAPGISAAISEGDIWQLTVYGEYINFTELREPARILPIEEVLGKLSGHARKAAYSAQTTCLQYVAYPMDEGTRYEIVPCWSFYAGDGQLLLDIDATEGTPV